VQVAVADEPLASGLAEADDSQQDNKMWIRMLSALNIQVADLEKTHGTMLAPTDRVRPLHSFRMTALCAVFLMLLKKKQRHPMQAQYHPSPCGSDT
jgi:hypothetical protein